MLRRRHARRRSWCCRLWSRGAMTPPLSPRGRYRVGRPPRRRKRMRLKLALLVVPSVLAVLAVGASPVSAIAKPQTFSLLSVEGTGSEIGGFDFQREPVPGDRFAFT